MFRDIDSPKIIDQLKDRAWTLISGYLTPKPILLINATQSTALFMCSISYYTKEKFFDSTSL